MTDFREGYYQKDLLNLKNHIRGPPELVGLVPCGCCGCVQYVNVCHQYTISKLRPAIDETLSTAVHRGAKISLL